MMPYAAFQNDPPSSHPECLNTLKIGTFFLLISGWFSRLNRSFIFLNFSSIYKHTHTRAGRIISMARDILAMYKSSRAGWGQTGDDGKALGLTISKYFPKRLQLYHYHCSVLLRHLLGWYVAGVRRCAWLPSFITTVNHRHFLIISNPFGGLFGYSFSLPLYPAAHGRDLATRHD